MCTIAKPITSRRNVGEPVVGVRQRAFDRRYDAVWVSSESRVIAVDHPYSDWVAAGSNHSVVDWSGLTERQADRLGRWAEVDRPLGHTITY
jgi:hypothetical protein